MILASRVTLAPKVTRGSRVSKVLLDRWDLAESKVRRELKVTVARLGLRETKGCAVSKVSAVSRE